jgi:hypothetical protein
MASKNYIINNGEHPRGGFRGYHSKLEKFISQRDFFNLEKLVFDYNVINGKAFSKTLDLVKEMFPNAYHHLGEEEFTKAIKELRDISIQKILPNNISELYQNTIVQHVSIYEQLYDYFKESGSMKPALLAMKQKEALLNLIAETETVVEIEQTEVVEQKSSFNFDLLSSKEKAKLNSLMEKAGFNAIVQLEEYTEYETV